MSILIKGMDMPKSCISCRLMVNCDTCEGWECICTALDANIGYLTDIPDNRREDCPLVELPPHRDLIDREWLLDIALQLMNTAKNDDIFNGVKWLWQYILEAPTIIEAEEGKDA